jgi:organic hydroperoxide reductase OsmC/OhrA
MKRDRVKVIRPTSGDGGGNLNVKNTSRSEQKSVIPTKEKPTTNPEFLLGSPYAYEIL